VHGGIVSGVFDLEPRKGVVRAFDFLQAKHVRLHLAQIGKELLQAQSDRIDVPGGDTQGETSNVRCLVAPLLSSRKSMKAKSPACGRAFV
jgi:hypothetical protein